MKAFILIFLLTGSCLSAQAQANTQSAQPKAVAGIQEPASRQPAQPAQPQAAPAGQPPVPMQQPAQPPASMQQQGPAGAQQPAAGPGQGYSNVASTLHVYAYPKANQSQDQQSRDESECYQWAQGQSASANQGQPAQQGQSSKAGSGATVKGSAGGAATGAAIGAVTGDAGTGAAVGAVGGAAVGHRKKKKAKEQAEKQQQAQQAQATDNVKRAYAACMESRNYTVK
jgi:outer membrane protein with glycine zipper